MTKLLRLFGLGGDAPLVVRQYDPGCVVPTDYSEITRHAAPVDDDARRRLREQAIARLRPDPSAVRAREVRIAVERGRVTGIRRRA